MGVRWRAEFKSDADVDWKIDIHDSTYSGAVNAISLAVNEVRISYKGGAERNDPFFTSELSVPIMLYAAEFEYIIGLVNNAQEERFGAMVYKNTVLEWVGTMVTDTVDIEDIYYPYVLDLKFADGIARLKDVDYHPEGSIYSGYENLAGHIVKALAFTGVTQYYSANDNFLRAVFGWHTIVQGYSASKCTLIYLRLRHEAWYDYVDGVLKFKKAYDVLKEILSSLNARIFMAGGKFNVVQTHEYQYNTYYSQILNKSGTLLSSNTADSDRVTPTSAQRLEGGQSKFYPALRQVMASQKHKMSTNWGNLLPPPTGGQYETQVTLLDTVYGGVDTDLCLKFDGIVHQWFIGPSGGQFKFKYRMDVILTLTDNSKRYLYNGANLNTYTWETDSAKYCTYYSTVGTNSTWSSITTLSFLTPEIPTDSTVTFKFYDLGLYDQYGNVATLPAGVSYGYECVNFFMKQPVDGSDAEVPDTKYYAYNYKAGTSTFVDSRSVLELSGLVGDYPTGVRTLSMYESSGTLIPNSWTAALFRLRNSPQSYTPRNMQVRNTLDGQRQPIQKYSGGWVNSSITGKSVLVWNSATKTRIWVPLSLTLSLRDDTAKGEWFDCVIPA